MSTPERHPDARAWEGSWDRYGRRAVASRADDGEVAYLATADEDLWRIGRAAPLEGDTVLDIGCGDGRVLRRLAPGFRRVIGTDVAEEPLATCDAALAGHGQVELRSGGAGALGELADRSVDLVLCLYVFQHVSDAEEVSAYVGEIARVVADGGVAILNTRRQSPLARIHDFGVDVARGAIRRLGVRTTVGNLDLPVATRTGGATASAAKPSPRPSARGSRRRDRAGPLAHLARRPAGQCLRRRSGSGRNRVERARCSSRSV
ncbi:MAG: class I SAM-dependent methyltransferase [Acidimicrobiia bacterium]|nr:class I SAM-dependent methyltransferase [Acidimicrobiia bacterium]